MVYKKFIVRNGKTYGPYIYHSKRVDGKVISEYHGNKEINKKDFNFIWIILGVFLLLAGGGLFFVLHHNSGISGEAVLNLNGVAINDSVVSGNLKISLNSGELIPANSRLVLENAGNSYEYLLLDILSDVETVEGNFYFHGENISGSGEGYGLIGEKKVYPEVSFVLGIYSKNSVSEGGSSENLSEDSESPFIEDNLENSSDEEPDTQNNNLDEPFSEEVVQEEPLDVEVVSEVSSELSSSEESQSEVSDSDSGSEISAEVSESSDSSFDSSSDSNSNSEISSEESSAPITGDSIRSFFGKISNSFLGLIRLTGNSISGNPVSEIEGQVSYGNPIDYDLSAGETAEIISSSESIKLEIKENVARVSTDYFDLEKGFGEDYFGEDSVEYDIDLSKLDLNFDNGSFVLKIIYDDSELFSFEGSLSEEIINSQVENFDEEDFGNSSLENVSDEKKILVKDISDSLTIEEKASLLTNFGNVDVNTIKSEKYNGRIFVSYAIGNYEVEFSYDSGLNDEILFDLMESDRIKWLKDLANSLSSSKNPPEEIEKFKGNFSF